MISTRWILQLKVSIALHRNKLQSIKQVTRKTTRLVGFILNCYTWYLMYSGDCSDLHRAGDGGWGERALPGQHGGVLQPALHPMWEAGRQGVGADAQPEPRLQGAGGQLAGHPRPLPEHGGETPGDQQGRLGEGERLQHCQVQHLQDRGPVREELLPANPRPRHRRRQSDLRGGADQLPSSDDGKTGAIVRQVLGGDGVRWDRGLMNILSWIFSPRSGSAKLRWKLPASSPTNGPSQCLGLRPFQWYLEDLIWYYSVSLCALYRMENKINFRNEVNEGKKIFNILK